MELMASSIEPWDIANCAADLTLSRLKDAVAGLTLVHVALAAPALRIRR
jgi:hypothetical protein